MRITATAMASVVIGLGVWSIRSGNDHGKPLSGSVAFAQTLEAMRKVEFYHVKGRQFEAGNKNNRFTGWHFTEIWFDAQRGLYMEIKDESVPGIEKHIKLPEGSTGFVRHLHLPTGMYYTRSQTDLRIDSQPAKWQRIKRAATVRFLDNLAAGVRRGSDAAPEPNPVSSRPGDWKGHAATVLTFEIKPPQKDAAKEVRKLRAVLYVDPTTSRLMARQHFQISADAVETLVLEFEVDYSQPDASHFDLAQLMKGAKLRPAIPGDTHIKKNPKKGAIP